jgi:hypothetical protein
MTGEQTIQTIRQQTDTVLLAFSRGKDAIAAWLALRPHFERIIPYHLDLVPGLEFVDESIAYFEHFFGQRIIRLPHPSFYRWMNNLTFQPPERVATIGAFGLPRPSYEDFEQFIREDLDLSPEAYSASGVRSADSPQRFMSFRKYGSINHGKRKFYPIWDWRKDRLIDEFTQSGVRLPVDYEMFGCSFDGIGNRFLAPLKARFPRDYQRVLDWFPMAELEIKRREYAGF